MHIWKPAQIFEGFWIEQADMSTIGRSQVNQRTPQRTHFCSSYLLSLLQVCFTLQHLHFQVFKHRKAAHILQKTQVTSYKMVHKKRYHFLAQFYMVCSVLLRVLAQKTTFWLVEILWQTIIRSFYSMVFEVNTCNKTEHTMWKGWKTVPENGIFSCVPFCLRRFARCAPLYMSFFA